MLQDHTPATDSARLELPPAPATETGAVKAWAEPVTMLTYAPGEPDPNPLFLEKRVYQGSNGKVYPLPVIDNIATTPAPQSWQAIHIENEFLRLMVMPEIGGRIHIGLDKRTGYDFFYRQNVIKPALVGLAGPWISGGVEFNWPQHHRPATFMPVETTIERSPDGSVTIWCSDHDPMARMKGMHGICLRPGIAAVEVKVRLYNRTVNTQTFLWWANVATRVHEHYQSFFPHDVRFAADHAKRAVTTYPLSNGHYYGVDYAERARTGVPAHEQPSNFVPNGSYAANDLGWYSNIPVPTSYMIVGSQGDFFGGYDHAAGAGTVAVANHHVSPGKKQWTWGNHDFGYAWDRSLTDSDGPYVELMSGVYTDNQPDFSFLAPGETKTFSQYWYPIASIGVPDQANLDAALRVEPAALHLQVTRPLSNAMLTVTDGTRELLHWQGDLTPTSPLHCNFPETANPVVRLEHNNQTILRFAPAEITPVEAPTVATEPPLPADVASNDELYLNGLHLEQYRHPTRAPEDYWMEALRRDPGDSRCAAALGRWHMRRGEFTAAEAMLSAALTRLTARNPNPYDGEPLYNLGLTRSFLGKTDAAYDSFYKSTWNAAWRGPAYHRLAEIDCRRADYTTALDHLDRSLRAEADNLNARSLKTLVLRKLNRAPEAETLLRKTHALDSLDALTRFLLRGEIPRDGGVKLDIAFDLVRAGFFNEALTILDPQLPNDGLGTAPLLGYLEAHILTLLNHPTESTNAHTRAAAASPEYVFPSRLDELTLLNATIFEHPDDSKAHLYLGNFLYDRRRHGEAIAAWETSAALNPTYSVVWRNLGFARQNILNDTPGALEAFRKARTLAPADARVLYEYDQLLKRIGTPIADRLAQLEANPTLVAKRDDLSVELASLLTSTGHPDRALAILERRHFQPWEGGEGLVLGEYVRANILLAQRALQRHDAPTALRRLHAASNPPANLAEAKHLLANLSMIDYFTAAAHAEAGDPAQAEAFFRRAAAQRGDFQGMQVKTISEMTYWNALALRALGREADARALFQSILSYARELETQTPKIDYFATSLPTLLLFDEDLKARQITTARFLEAQGLVGLGERDEALKLLAEVQQRDHSHTGAIDLLHSLEAPCKVQ